MERWITWKGRHLLVDDNGKIISNNKKYIGEKYTPENVNEYFKNIETYKQFEEFEKDYFSKTKMMPYIIPKKYYGKNNIREWVDFIKKIDEENISFSVLSEDVSWSRKTKSSIKNFVKNYRVHQE